MYFFLILGTGDITGTRQNSHNITIYYILKGITQRDGILAFQVYELNSTAAESLLEDTVVGVLEHHEQEAGIQL